MPEYTVAMTATFGPGTILDVIDGTPSLGFVFTGGAISVLPMPWEANRYKSGSVISIVADIPPTGQVFDDWVGNVGDVADVNAAITTITLNSASTITATYTDDGIADENMIYKDVLKDTYVQNDATTSPPLLDYRYMLNGDKNEMDIIWGHPGNPPAQPADPTEPNPPSDGNVHKRGFLEFDISDINDVDTATLWVYVSNADRDNDTSLNVYSGTTTFAELYNNWYFKDFSTYALWSSNGGDLDANTVATVASCRKGWNQIDVTNLVSAAVSAAQSSMQMVITRGTVTNSPFSMRTKNYVDPDPNNPSLGAQLWVDTTSTYDLTVVSGSGGGAYTPGAAVGITAEAAPTSTLERYAFDAWTGDTGGVADVNASSTTLTMPAADATVTATYGKYLHGDLNMDKQVQIIDLNMVLIDWGKSGGFADPNSDVYPSPDGTINITDLNTVLIDWGKSGFQP